MRDYETLRGGPLPRYEGVRLEEGVCLGDFEGEGLRKRKAALEAAYRLEAAKGVGRAVLEGLAILTFVLGVTALCAALAPDALPVLQVGLSIRAGETQ